MRRGQAGSTRDSPNGDLRKRYRVHTVILDLDQQPFGILERTSFPVVLGAVLQPVRAIIQTRQAKMFLIIGYFINSGAFISNGLKVYFLIRYPDYRFFRYAKTPHIALGIAWSYSP